MMEQHREPHDSHSRNTKQLQKALCDLVLQAVQHSNGHTLYGDGMPHQEMKRRLRPLADEARRLGLRAEHFIVLIKSACATVPGAMEIGSDEQWSSLKAQLVSIAIDEFFADGR